MPDVKLSQLAAASAASVAAGASMWSAKAAIHGLMMDWVSPTQLRVTSGAAWIPDAGQLVELASAVTVAASTLGNSVFGHAYLVYNAGSAPSVELVTTAPAAAYVGRARSKSGTGGTARRYLGSVLTDSAGGLYRFVHTGDDIHYLTNLLAPFRVLNNGTSTARVNVDLSPVLPVTASAVYGNAINNADQTLLLDIPEIGNPSGAARLNFMPNQRAPFTAGVPSRALTYQFPTAPGSGAGFIDVWGYRYER